MKKIKLTQGQFALVDDEDFERVNQFKWYANYNSKLKSFYAIRNLRKENGKRAAISMHSYIMNTPNGMCTDHRNHITLDNQKSNLRVCTRQQNQCNMKLRKKTSSKYKGVIWNKISKKWVAGVRFNSQLIYSGSFELEIEAAKAYNKKAEELHGSFAFLNKIPDDKNLKGDCTDGN